MKHKIAIGSRNFTTRYLRERKEYRCLQNTMYVMLLVALFTIAKREHKSPSANE